MYTFRPRDVATSQQMNTLDVSYHIVVT